MMLSVLSQAVNAAGGLPEWLGVGGAVAAASALLWLGSLNAKVDRHSSDLNGKVTREEFNGLNNRLDDIRDDVREIRRRLSNGHRFEEE
jgi:outer membrane murein-binding lipoprotein Lpp